MTLTARLLSELQRLGSASHPLARTLPSIVTEFERYARRVVALALCVACLMGFLLCYVWIGARIEVLSANIEEWRRVAEDEYRTHHAPVKIGKAAAQVITARKEWCND